MSTSNRIPSLDGFRAIAVLVVFGGHAQSYGLSITEAFTAMNERVAFIPARFGVTIFFFLSGYIITTLMRTEFERTATVSFRRFYLRRVYRIFPPLYIVLALAGLLTFAGLLKNSATVSGVAAQALHFTNYYGLIYSPYEFFQGTKLLWSLAVEEHFYLVFPLLFLSLARVMSYKQLAAALAVICAAVLAWRFYLYYGLNVQSSWAFIATDTRIDSILYGCIMGVWMNPAKDKQFAISKTAEAAAVALAIAALIFSIAVKNPAFQRTIMFSIQGIALMPLFYSAIHNPNWPIFRWLNWAPVVYIGTISYTFYLCHMIVLNIAEDYIRAPTLGITVAFIVIVAFCTVMYRTIEAPLARKRAELNRAADLRAASQTAS